MTKAPFTGQSERKSDLLGLMSSVARGGFQYFITFTDDFSRYGYIYLMRHMSESFEKFKKFRMKYKINYARELNFYDPIVGVNI
jgi:hypothetical protein